MERADLPASLRKVLERAIREARIAAETGASDAIRRLGVASPSPPAHLDQAARELRVRLRAHARSLGDNRRADDSHDTARLTEEAAYAHWHRLLFARFLLERRLLREPESGGEVTFDDCRELAAIEGVPDAWAVAERFASAMLPGVFRLGDPTLLLAFAPEHAALLQKILRSIDPEIFQADDSLGWTYQFWRAAERDAVTSSGVKIGAKELPAVTQLFTEPYMVRFLLHNTLGAWWAGKVLAIDPQLASAADDEDVLRTGCALPGIDWEYLRFVKDGDTWRPAAGTFSGWPREAKAITVLDPCCGSGHFLVEAFAILASLRVNEEKITSAAAVAAVLKDNLFGLEIDGRCVQLASFAIALAAWRLGGHTTVLPNPHIAWVGAPPPQPKAEFLALGKNDKDLELALAALHDLFARAPVLGSLLDPTGCDLVDPIRISRVEQLLGSLLANARKAEPEKAEGVIAARGMVDAAALLFKRYTLQVTNVPFLGRAKQCSDLSQYIDAVYPNARADLATTMLWRMKFLSANGGTFAAVTPQNWLHLGSYRKFRTELLETTKLIFVIDLGPAAFREMNWWAARTSIVAFSLEKMEDAHTFMGLNADTGREFEKRPNLLRRQVTLSISQEGQFKNPDNRIVLSTEWGSTLLSASADYGKGSTTGDGPRFIMNFWELSHGPERHELWLNSPDIEARWGGRSTFLKCKRDNSELNAQLGCRIHGQVNWGRRGIAINKMRNLYAFYYDGELFDDNIATIVPKKETDLLPIASFLMSDKYRAEIRKIDQKVSVTAATLSKAAFDINVWQEISSKQFPNGLPGPFSQDPTQWLFHSHPADAEPGTALHISLARLAGFRWPAENDLKMRLAPEARAWVAKAASLPDASADGLLCLPPVAGERSLADRLRSFLAAALGKDWSDATERRLLAETDERFQKKLPSETSLEGWLRDRAFRQHCALFLNRPFLWHIWDGQKDGFAAIIHYHRLNRANLEKLTFSLLGDWISRMKANNDGRRVEAATILQERLQAILEGEGPYDIFVRWKPLAKQPLGWEPDLDDGVRINIRPFVEAEVFREVPNVKWTKDRGTDVKSAPWYDVFKGQRINDHHTTLAEKRRARGLK